MKYEDALELVGGGERAAPAICDVGTGGGTPRIGIAVSGARGASTDVRLGGMGGPSSGRGDVGARVEVGGGGGTARSGNDQRGQLKSM